MPATDEASAFGLRLTAEIKSLGLRLTADRLRLDGLRLAADSSANSWRIAGG